MLMLSYKQATLGDCNIGRPGGLDLKGQYKWDAWNSVRGTRFVFTALILGMPNEEARGRYVSIVKDLFARHGMNF
jgi:diazepam-binding inhibitor (GABA receptor modulator, acyl-CoA-binding protein)